MYVKYVGKKLPFKFKSPLTKAVIDVGPDRAIFEMERSEFDKITSYNPTGFLEEVKVERLSSRAILPQKEVIQEAVEKVRKPKKEPELECENCGRKYFEMHKM